MSACRQTGQTGKPRIETKDSLDRSLLPYLLILLSTKPRIETSSFKKVSFALLWSKSLVHPAWCLPVGRQGRQANQGLKLVKQPAGVGKPISLSLLSTKLRIETSIWSFQWIQRTGSKSLVQQTKDWNHIEIRIKQNMNPGLSLLSTKLRIETVALVNSKLSSHQV